MIMNEETQQYFVRSFSNAMEFCLYEDMNYDFANHHLLEDSDEDYVTKTGLK